MKNRTPATPPRQTILGFRMPSIQTMVSRKSSITNAFVNSIIPVIPPTPDEVREALGILDISQDDVRCAYCGDKATEWDHLRPLVVKRRPTGYISEIANLVPCCGKCNQSKGNTNWRTWMFSKASLSPATRGVTDLEGRARRLDAYEKWREIRPINFEAIIGADQWSKYWESCEQAISNLRNSQELGDKLKSIILLAHQNPLSPPQNDGASPKGSTPSPQS